MDRGPKDEILKAFREVVDGGETGKIRFIRIL